MLETYILVVIRLYYLQLLSSLQLQVLLLSEPEERKRQNQAIARILEPHFDRQRAWFALRVMI